VSLEAAVALTVGMQAIDASLDVAAGETIALLGPNGAGKTTVLRALAGLQPIGQGSIVLDGIVLDDGGRTWVPPERRAVGFVFQDAALFPHLDARDNVAFGVRARGGSRAEARRVAAEWLDRFGLAERATTSAVQLSGGEAQRVALARALAVRPRLLLLDEPLAALDQQVRADVRRDLRTHLDAHTGMRVLVTHDPIDAAVLADRIVVIERGCVVQTGTLGEITEQPRSQWIAELVGTNLLVGDAHGDRVRVDGGFEVVVPDSGFGPVHLTIHPHSVGLAPTRPVGSARNAWPTTVEQISELGGRARVRLQGPVSLTAEVTADAVRDLGLGPGSSVWASVKATDISVCPR